MVLRAHTILADIRQIILPSMPQSRRVPVVWSILFYVLGGVKTGCPLSSLSFFLYIDPFVYLFARLSDVPGFSITRMCADDFVSTLRMMSALRTHASIFKLAARVAGLHLKPGRSVFIFSCIQLCGDTLHATKNCL